MYRSVSTDTGSVAVGDDMAWQWLYFMHGSTTAEDLVPRAEFPRPAAWDAQAQEQWERLRDQYAAALVAPRRFGSDPDGFRAPPGLDGPEFVSLGDLPRLRAWCAPLFPAFLEWNRGGRSARIEARRRSPGGTGLSPMLRAVRTRLPADRAVRIVEVALRTPRVLHRCRAETPTGTVVGLVVTAALLADEESFTGACRHDLFD